MKTFALARYTDNGALDPSFGTAGTVITPIGNRDDIGQSVAVQSDGKIIVAGASDNGGDFDVALVRYTANGALDPGFGTGGKVTTPVGSSADIGSGLALQRDGIVVAGWSTVGTNFNIALLRYADSGALDPSFGTVGKVTTPVGGGNAYALIVAVQSDGKVVVAGWSEEGSSSVIALVRYAGDLVATPPTLSIARPEATTFSITLTGAPNSTNQIEFTDKLQSPTSTPWRALGAVKLDGQGIGTFQDNSSADMRLYRAVYP